MRQAGGERRLRRRRPRGAGLVRLRRERACDPAISRPLPHCPPAAQGKNRGAITRHVDVTDGAELLEQAHDVLYPRRVRQIVDLSGARERQRFGAAYRLPPFPSRTSQPPPRTRVGRATPRTQRAFRECISSMFFGAPCMNCDMVRGQRHAQRKNACDLGSGMAVSRNLYILKRPEGHVPSLRTPASVRASAARV